MVVHDGRNTHPVERQHVVLDLTCLVPPIFDGVAVLPVLEQHELLGCGERSLDAAGLDGLAALQRASHQVATERASATGEQPTHAPNRFLRLGRAELEPRRQLQASGQRVRG